ncbi:hypothetical protein EDC01DRAFT_630421 [Geopyxis carbonaria]|nr:hypothetical protein EDC01DRAFT_630421 [Geopyxis carbonaria]
MRSIILIFTAITAVAASAQGYESPKMALIEGDDGPRTYQDYKDFMTKKMGANGFPIQPWDYPTEYLTSLAPRQTYEPPKSTYEAPKETNDAPKETPTETYIPKNTYSYEGPKETLKAPATSKPTETYESKESYTPMETYESMESYKPVETQKPMESQKSTDSYKSIETTKYQPNYPINNSTSVALQSSTYVEEKKPYPTQDFNSTMINKDTSPSQSINKPASPNSPAVQTAISDASRVNSERLYTSGWAAAGLLWFMCGLMTGLMIEGLDMWE